MAGCDQTVNPRPLTVEASVTSLQTIEYLRETRPGWSVVARAIEFGGVGAGFVFPPSPEVGGMIAFTREVAALLAEVKGTRFVTRVSP